MNWVPEMDEEVTAMFVVLSEMSAVPVRLSNEELNVDVIVRLSPTVIWVVSYGAALVVF